MFDDFKTLISDDDRKPSEVTTYTLSPEELKKYDNIKPSGLRPILTLHEENMRKRRLDMNIKLRSKAERMLNEGKSIEEIAKDLGYTFLDI